MTTQTVARRDDYEITQAPAALAIRAGQEFWNDKQRAALAVLGIRNASNGDLAVYMHYCQKTGLDPFSKQIYMINRREKQNNQWVDKWTIQVGIDGFRVIRDRIAQRLGVSVEYEDTIWYDAEGREHTVWLSDAPPAACRVVVLKDGRRFPGVVRTAAYAQTKSDGELVKQWRTQPDHMIEKCAEAKALRRAFPNDLGGIYLEEEMPVADQQPTMAAQPSTRVTAADITGQPDSGEPLTGAVHPPAAEPETPPARGRQPRNNSGGRLGQLLAHIPLGSDEEVADFLAWRTNRMAARTVDDLTPAEVEAIAAYLDQALAGNDNNATEAASMIWTQFHQEREATQGGGE